MDNIIHTINDDLSRKNCDISEPSTSLEEMSFVKSRFINRVTNDFDLPDDAVPPDKAFLRSLCNIKICTLQLQRSPRLRQPDKDDANDGYKGKDLKWEQDEDGIWNMPEEKITDTRLDDDPIQDYERTAIANDVVMWIVNTPVDVKRTTNVKRTPDITITHEEQSDTGANANITPHAHLLHDIRWFEVRKRILLCRSRQSVHSTLRRLMVSRIYTCTTLPMPAIRSSALPQYAVNILS